MSAPEFQPGDRVLSKTGKLRIVSFPDDEGVMLPAQANHLNSGPEPWFTLVSRPVYPKPGEVVVALDADDVTALDEVCHLYARDWTLDSGVRVEAIIRRAREAVPS